MDAIIGQLSNLLGSLQRRVLLMLGRGKLRRVDDSGPVQVQQVALLSGEIRDGIECIQQFGFTSHPPLGSEVVAVFHGGSRDHGVVMATGHRGTRPRGLHEGEVMLYNSSGDSIRLRRDGIIEISTRNKILLHGDMEVTGVLQASDVRAGSVSLRQHIHSIPSGPNTNPPIP